MAQELNTAALPTEHQHGSPLSTHSSSSGDEEEFGLFQALPVADVRIEDLAWEYLPQSVEEYLARVRLNPAPFYSGYWVSSLLQAGSMYKLQARSQATSRRCHITH